MILCDMDGVLATGRGMDTAHGHPIYRTFIELPEQLGRIREAGIALHIVTAKVEAEAVQVLEAIGLEPYITSVVGANRLFWPTVWAALRKGHLPGSLTKSVYPSVLPAREGRRVVMIEDRRDHLCDMLAAGVIDFGILVPPISVSGDRVASWFDLDLALGMARELETGAHELARWVCPGVSAYSWRGGEARELEPSEYPAAVEGGGCFFSIPALPHADPRSQGPTLDALDTGKVLRPGRTNLVTTVRAGRRVVRRLIGRKPPSTFR